MKPYFPQSHQRSFNATVGAKDVTYGAPGGTWPPLTRKLVHAHLTCTFLHAFLVQVPPPRAACTLARSPTAVCENNRRKVKVNERWASHLAVCHLSPQMETLITLPPPLPHALPSPPGSCCHIHTHHHILSTKLQCWPVIHY